MVPKTLPAFFIHPGTVTIQPIITIGKTAQAAYLTNITDVYAAEILRWRKYASQDASLKVRDAIDNGAHAAQKWRSRRSYDYYVDTPEDVLAAKRDNPHAECSMCKVLTALPGGEALGVVHFRVTWAFSLALDFLAASPRFLRDEHQVAEGQICGIGVALMAYATSLGLIVGCKKMWAEVTQNSTSFYERAFDLSCDTDVMLVGRSKFEEYTARYKNTSMERLRSARADGDDGQKQGGQ